MSNTYTFMKLKIHRLEAALADARAKVEQLTVCFEMERDWRNGFEHQLAVERAKGERLRSALVVARPYVEDASGGPMGPDPLKLGVTGATQTLREIDAALADAPAPSSVQPKEDK